MSSRSNSSLLHMRLTFCAATFLAISPAVGIAQVECAPCTMRLSRVVQLGTSEGPGALGSGGLVARAADGRYYVVTSEMADEIKVFGADGRYIESIGRSGSGPGEFRSIWRLMIADDELHVFDAENSRHSVYNLPDHALQREIPMPFSVMNIAVLPRNTLIVNANIRTPELAGIPLHRISEDGELSASFGETSEIFRSDVGYPGHRVIAASGDQAIWASSRTRYALTRWSANGQRLSSLDRDPSWFEPHLQTVSFKPDRPPPPLVTQIREDAQGWVWVLISVADRRWRDAVTLRTDHPDGPTYVPEDMDLYFDTIIEVLDPASGAIVASGRVDRYLTRFAADRRLFSFTDSADLTPRVDIWRVDLIPSSK